MRRLRWRYQVRQVLQAIDRIARSEAEQAHG